MKIGVLTSNYQRHTFFANHLTQNLPVRVVVVEPKAANPREVGGNDQENIILNTYFDQRDQSEREILTGGEKLNLPNQVLKKTGELRFLSFSSDQFRVLLKSCCRGFYREENYEPDQIVRIPAIRAPTAIRVPTPQMFPSCPLRKR